MGVVLARAATVEAALEKASHAAAQITVEL
jgi:formate-dependent phosphoribosylglycinamide formyltransferase (GAR transformylase)